MKILRTTRQVDVVSGKTFADCQNIVGGYVETCPLSPAISGAKRMLLLVNEDGLSLNLPLNPLASALAARTIVGDVVLLESPKEIKEVLN